MIRVIQNNMDRTRGLSVELREVIVKERIDVLAGQEPHVWRNKVMGFVMMARVVCEESGERPWAAVVVFNSKTGAMKVGSLCGSNCVTVELMFGNVCSIHYIVSIQRELRFIWNC